MKPPHEVHHGSGGGELKGFVRREHKLVGEFDSALRKFARYEKRAHSAWAAYQKSHPQHHGPPTPGAGSPPPVAGAPPVDVYSLIGGGPAAASYGQYAYFARGGSVRRAAGGHVTAGMSLARPMGTGGLAGLRVPPPRTLSEAAARSGAGAAMGSGAGGIQIGQMTINNPVPEPAGESVTRAVQRSAFLAGRGQ